MINEKLINVPLDPETKAWLEARAASNDRATGREALVIIKAEKARDAATRPRSKQ